MPAGRPRKSPLERKLSGIHPEREIPFQIFEPEGAPFVPEHLSDDAQACMEFIIRNYPTKMIASIDSYVLSVFAHAWAWHKAAVEAMNDPNFEPVITGSNDSEQPNPWFKIVQSQARLMITCATKLYLTPADRSALRSVGQPAPKSKFDGLLGQSKSKPSLNA